eukprot:186290-Rhodomonas_salina.1
MVLVCSACADGQYCEERRIAVADRGDSGGGGRGDGDGVQRVCRRVVRRVHGGQREIEGASYCACRSSKAKRSVPGMWYCARSR